MKKILILGSRGFLGSATLEHLESKGYCDVLGCVEDIRDKELIEPYFKNAEFVIHAAGETKRIQDETACQSINVWGTRNVIELCLENNCKLIHLGSTARKMAYGRSKEQSEKEVTEASGKGLKTIVLKLCPIVHLNDPLMKWGRRYPLEDLVRDIEGIIENHDFNRFKLIDYKQFKNEKSSRIYFSRTQV